ENVGEILESELNALHSGDCARNEAVARSQGVELRCPLLDEKVVRLALSIPASEKFEGERKSVLRTIARELGVPEEACARKKQALQYGSGIHRILLKRMQRVK
ncbi:asparagine synthetase B, partial [Candidatus Micrarchaeota archaeon]